ncbi:bifunctional 2-polyprenyl-6-hydroxyphenol methylase/3-demethylubiquinol 3-O-methyltransferase UbiG [Methylococcus sp. EFPC2]|uniref:class I SAM-dependent methyltransferase n=1 Tax=Methylococcus sp. EFPC2 TaxID=2812648 RepID=UPI0019689A95|nr:class I SAM-dependent methyltransferase [Methylococcus sp. EFPC2]QSA98461.1 class I SAM-dependent methyltransferase [Methylococcus sp. EFPC2]
MYEEKSKDYFSSARSIILDIVPPKAERVLEIGCGSGRTLAMLKNEGICRQTVGIELFQDAARQAEQNVDTVYCLDVENSALPAGLGRFELILMLDVLEHLQDPWSFLYKLKTEHLLAGGKVIISLPNARHFSLVLPLLMGRFDYEERGIRDKTHLRFFTKKTMLELISGAGLTIEKSKRTSLELHLNSGKLNILTLGIFADFLTSQYIFCCTTAQQQSDDI